MGAGLAVASVVGCGGGNEGPAATAGPSGTPAGTGTAVATGTAGRHGHAPAALEPAKTRGGTIRWFGLDPLTLDTLDPHQTQLAAVYNMQGAVFSKVLKYDDEYEGLIGTDLAETVPEVVDKTTYVIKIRPNVFFHDTERIRNQFPEVAGPPAHGGRRAVQHRPPAQQAESQERPLLPWLPVGVGGHDRDAGWAAGPHPQDHHQGSDSSLQALSGRHLRHHHPQGARGPGQGRHERFRQDDWQRALHLGEVCDPPGGEVCP